MWNTPGPAPPSSSSSQRQQIRQFSRLDRRNQLRQHHSMDDQNGLYGIESDELCDPLSISTTYQPSNRIGAPLSNPISTNHSFWNNPSNINVPIGLKGYNLEAEYGQLRQEYTATVEKLNETMFSIKTFWSPELKRERQLRREEQNRISMLERRLIDNDNIHLRSSLEGGISIEMEEQIMILQDKICRLQETLRLKDEQIASLCINEPNESRKDMENTLIKIDEKNERIIDLEDEIVQLRNRISSKPRDFTEKGSTNHEIITLRMKMERSEVELSEKKQELMTCQTRLRNAEDELNELRSHVQLLKDTSTSKEEQSTLLLGDVEALRSKLEMRNRSIEQKEQQIEKNQKELNDMKAESNERMENIRKMEVRNTQVLGRLEHIEGELRDKEREIEKMKQRLAAHPDTNREREWNARFEEGERERQRLQQSIDEVRIAAEKEHKAQLETYQSEVTRLRQTVETLETELADRDVLLESQNEKIGDMGREISIAEKKMNDAMIDKGTDEIRKELESARNEVDKLLKMLHNLEKEKTTLTVKCKQLMGEKDSSADEIQGLSGVTNVKQRIQELEEALAESVSITAEREVHLQQQKQLLAQTSNQLGECRRENKELRSRLSNTSGEGHESLVKSIEMERKQHMEQLYQLKQEALLSAISEKEAHIALLERSNGPQNEIDTVRRHKEGLMRKLQEENERRSYLHHPNSSRIPLKSSTLPILPGNISSQSHGVILPGGVSYSSPSNQQRQQLLDTNDDGIWA